MPEIRFFLFIPNGFFDIAKSLSYTASRYVSITTSSEVWGFALRATAPRDDPTRRALAEGVKVKLAKFNIMNSESGNIQLGEVTL
jgi:hypothetical protein